MPLSDPDRLVLTLAEGLKRTLDARGVAAPLIVGIHTGGLWIAERVAPLIGAVGPVGALNISFHRDDFGRVGLNPSVKPSQLPWDIDGRAVVLIDDVLHTGRTVRAALNEIFDWGRPSQVIYGALVVRDGRELPIEADAYGMTVVLPRGQQIKLRGPAPLALELIDAAT